MRSLLKFLPIKNRLYLALTIALSVCGGSAALGLVWAQFRSFDVMDGGDYFLLYQDPADNPDTHTRFHLLGRPIWLLCGQDIVVFRIACLVIATAVCLIFWRRFRDLHTQHSQLDLSCWPVWFATMAGLTWVPLALTYNSLATLLDLLALAAIVPGLGYGKAGARIRPVPIVLGLIVALLVVLAKPPAALVLFAAIFLLLGASPAISAKRRIWLFIGMSLVTVFALLGVITYLRERGIDAAHPIQIAGLFITPDWIVATITRYGAELATISPSISGDFTWTLGPTLLAVVVLTLPICGAWIESGALGLLLISIVAAFVTRNLWDSSFSNIVSGGPTRFYLLMWGALVPVLAASSITRRRNPIPSRRYTGTWAWIIILSILPIVSSVGSTNTVYVSALHATVFWSAGLLLAADCISYSLAVPWFRPAVACVLCAGAASHIWSSHFLRPYMYQPSLWKQTEAVEIGYPPTTLKVDPSLADFIRYVRKTLVADGFKPGDDVFGFFNLPGIIFAIGAKEPGAPWYFGTWYHQDDTDGGKLRRVPLERRKRAWIITQADVVPYRKQFLESGIDFPDGYRKIGSTINPTTGLEIGIWKPADRH